MTLATIKRLVEATPADIVGDPELLNLAQRLAPGALSRVAWLDVQTAALASGNSGATSIAAAVASGTKTPQAAIAELQGVL